MYRVSLFLVLRPPSVLLKGKQMKTAAFFLLLLLPCAHASPVDDMNELIDALYRADGEAVYRCLSHENRESLAMMLTMFRLAPQELAGRLRQELGVQLSSSDISILDEGGLVRVIIDSPGFRSEMPPSRDMITCENYSMRGDTAVVHVNVCGWAGPYSYSMIMQEGDWKLAANVLGD